VLRLPVRSEPESALEVVLIVLPHP
jgi:hypothetical protein